MKKLTVFLLAVASMFVAGCHKDLDLFPANESTSESVFSTPAGYRQGLAKLYQALAVTDGDVPGEVVSDDGNTGFLRQLWYMQSLSTDEAAWTFFSNTDPIGIHQMNWTANNQTVAGLYYRCYYVVAVCNNFIQQSEPGVVARRGISGADATAIATYRAEARFLRAYMYHILLDHFGAVPFVDDAVAIGSTNFPTQLSRAEVFAFVESELKALEDLLPAARAAENGRVDRGAAWALLARHYLNAEVYTRTARYTEAITYSKKVIDAGYSLHPDYTQLMLADNNTLVGTEFIWTIRFDGTNTQTFSGTTFLVHAPAGVPGAISGTNGTWECIRITEQFVQKFGGSDTRGQFWTTNQNLNMNTLLGDPRQGYSSIKFRNLTRSGARGPNTDANGTFVDVDFPVFRLAEMYLTYAEAVARGGAGGSSATALEYLQALARRAKPTDPNATVGVAVSLPYIIDERGREMFWECTRRSDLVRFGQFTTAAYLWAWKGDVRNGTAVDSKYNLYPIPATDVSSNPGIKQNLGY